MEKWVSSAWSFGNGITWLSLLLLHCKSLPTYSTSVWGNPNRSEWTNKGKDYAGTGDIFLGNMTRNPNVSAQAFIDTSSTPLDCEITEEWKHVLLILRSFQSSAQFNGYWMAEWENPSRPRPPMRAREFFYFVGGNLISWEWRFLLMGRGSQPCVCMCARGSWGRGEVLELEEDRTFIHFSNLRPFQLCPVPF